VYGTPCPVTILLVSDWPEDPTVPGGPPPDEEETVVQGGVPPEPPPPPPSGPPPPGGPPPPAGPPPEEAERDLWPWLLGLLLLVVAGILLAYFLTRGGGHKTKPVPAVVGQTQSAATTRLHDAGFAVTSKNTFSHQPKNIVVTQKPAAGSEQEKGSTVTLFVSQGRKQVAIPNVLGLQQSEAVAQLTKAGLDSAVVLVPNAAPSGRVISQSPASGTKVSPGTTVRLNVSRGRNQTTTVTKTVTNTRTHATTQTTPTTTRVTTTTATTTFTTTTTP
jgi:beta-lactam-binding protein with PASTA domain